MTNSILRPGYLRWDGTKYVLDPSVEIVGPPGPPGPAGAPGPQGNPGPAGTSGNALLVWQPGGTASGNIYTSWTALMAARATTPHIPMTIVIDTSIQPFPSIDTGTWNLAGNTAIVSYLEGQNVPFNIPSGGTIQNPSMFRDLTVSAISMSTAAVTQTTATIGLDIINTTFGSAGILNVTIFNGQINFYGNGGMVSASINWVDGGHAGNVAFNMYDSSSFHNNILHFTTASAFLNINSLNATFSTSLNTFTNVNGVAASFTGSGTTGNVLTITGTNTAAWQPGVFTASGDLAGTSTSQQVLAITGTGSNPYTGVGTSTSVKPTETSLGSTSAVNVDSFVFDTTINGNGSFQNLFTLAMGSFANSAQDWSISLLALDTSGPTAGLFRCDLTFTTLIAGGALNTILQPSSPANPLNVRQQASLNTVTAQVTSSGNTLEIQVFVPNSIQAKFSMIAQVQWRN